jgi:hypothetical protein
VIGQVARARRRDVIRHLVRLLTRPGRHRNSARGGRPR